MKQSERKEDCEIFKEVFRIVALLPTSLMTLAVVWDLPVKVAIPIGIVAAILAYIISYAALRIGAFCGVVCATGWKKIIG